MEENSQQPSGSHPLEGSCLVAPEEFNMRPRAAEFQSMRLSRLLLVASLFVLPATVSAAPVLSPGELSVGAEFSPASRTYPRFAIAPDRDATPSAGFNVRYAFSQQLAVTGTVGFQWVTIADGVEDPAVAYSFGVGGQFNFAQSKLAALMVKGGLQFIPRVDRDQELGVRLYVGPGVEARVVEALSIQFYTALMNLQLGGDTRFDLEVMPSLAMYLYF